MNTFKKSVVALTCVSALLLSACKEEAVEGACTEEELLEKSNKVVEKIQEMSTNPANLQKMQDVMVKMQELTESLEPGTSDKEALAKACKAYDEVLADLES